MIESEEIGERNTTEGPFINLPVTAAILETAGPELAWIRFGSRTKTRTDQDLNPKIGWSRLVGKPV